ncbi:MAG: hypothetical protein ACI8TQ_001676 [Planctomycetota bacterium]|jgi:hypothetical protein
MERLQLNLLRASYAASWLIVGISIACIVLDRSGWIGDSIRGRVMRALPGLDVEIESARVLWFRPGLVLENVRLDAGDGFLEFETIEVRLIPALSIERLFHEIEINGGSVRVTDELIRAIRSTIEERALRESTQDTDNLALFNSSVIPTITLTDFDVDLIFPGEAAVPIGRVDLKLEDANGEHRLSGRLLPALAGSTPEAAVHIGGSLHGEQLKVRASAQDLPVDIARLPRSLVPVSPIIKKAAARLSLAFEGGFTFNNEVRPYFEGRLGLTEGVVEISESKDAIAQIDARMDLIWSPDESDGLWSEQAWKGLARVAANWAGTELEAFGRLGENAGEDVLQSWVVIPALPLAKGQRPDIELGPGIEKVLETLGLSGTGNLAAAVRVPALRFDGEPWSGTQFVLDVRPRDDAGVRYDGWRNETGETYGIPMPASQIDGRVVFGFAPGHDRPSRLGLVELSASLPSGSVAYTGTLVSPPTAAGPDAQAEFQMELWVPDASIDEHLRTALNGMPATRNIWSEYGLQDGGQLSTRWRFDSAPELQGLSVWGEVDFQADQMGWAELPIPMHDVDGHFAIRWSDRAVQVVETGNPSVDWRAYGLKFTANGNLATGGTVDAQISYRNETPSTSTITPAQMPVRGTNRHRINLSNVSLSGADFDILTEALPVVAVVAEQIGLDGQANVLYFGSTHGSSDPYRFDLGIEPTQLALLPTSFPVPLSDLRGRAIVTGVRSITPTASDSPEYDISIRGALTASSSEGFVATGIPEFESGEPMQIKLHCAGVNPNNKELIRLFRNALNAESEEPLPPDATTLGGRIDGGIEISIPVDSEEAPTITARVELRNNTLSAGRFQLDDMNGTAVFEGLTLRGDSIRARLANSPVELVDFRLVPSQYIGELEQPDRLLADPRFQIGQEGLVVQCKLRARNFALSAENLSLFLDPETVSALIDDAELRGQINFEDTSLVLVPDRNDGLKVGMHGTVVPQNIVVRAGFPIQVSSGQVELEELRIESGQTRVLAHVSELFGRIAGRQIEKVSMLVTLMESHLAIENLHGILEQGSIASLTGANGTSALSINLQAPHYFSAALEIGREARVDANGLLQGLFESSITDKGKTSGWLRVSGRPDDILGLRGTGYVEVREAQLWSIPVVRALFGQLGFDSTALFDRMETKFRLQDGQLQLSEMDVRSPILHIVGHGAIDFDGRLHHDLEIKYTLINLLGPLKVLLYWIQNSILRVAIRGTMWQPEIVLRNGITDLFRGEPEDHPSLPLPSYSSLPTRF